MRKICQILCVGLVSSLSAQGDYCSNECYGDKSSRIPPFEFHLGFPHSTAYYRKHQKTREHMLKKCHEAFTSKGTINLMSKTFKNNCAHAKEAQDQENQAHLKNQTL
ncbi:hypothetical protein [Helicobacter felis]|uniref:hypothetical protein n=1 Tax=Helicobacter felis TaxID=214 RepID=UPI000CF05D49|nr:hypothetical protein [Helicobacter felis]